ALLSSGTARLDGSEGLVNVGDDVVDVLDAHRNPHKVLGDAGGGEFFGVELAVGCRGRVAGQGFGVADIDQTIDHLEAVDELAACFTATLDAEADDARGLALIQT